MSKLVNALGNMRALEELTEKSTIIHRLHPMVKMMTTLVYLVVVISFDKYDLNGLIPFAAYPVLMLALSETPYKPLFSRLLIALPFSIFAGLSNVFFERNPAVYLLGIPLSYGFISFSSIIFKTLLTVMAVLILVSTTQTTKLAHELIRMKLPKIVVLQMMLTYRYISVLIEETASMITAYHMRSPRQKGIAMADMGTFAGQLLLRTFGKADRIYHAMKCRGFDGEYRFAASDKIKKRDLVYMIVLISFFIGMRVIPIGNILGGQIGL